ncbi:GNAT family N-acetyltransferase [Streptomyces varsoviensis]|uniref:GCN5 family acetyltransferase n=1 Tax=Streptomyces varsoviensis TaxID=67373 RepID=A0ABR5J5X6_9ACTN|nr:GNAT family N-acetyltransferase [Streptomyces varsoviensis]KOG88862.1 GCN5 family acetyltransferase [Streptomyces varsoviensis]
MNPLASLLTDLAKGVFPPSDGRVDVVPQPSRRDCGVLAVTGHTVVFADTEADWVRGRLPPGDLSAPLNPPFLTALCARMGRTVDNIDLLAVAPALPGPPPLATALAPARDRDHPRIVRALRHRDDVRAWTHPGGTVLLGRGVAGRWELAVEVDPRARGTGLGRRLATAARHLVPGGEPLWAQVAPGNAASVRALLAAGFAPVGAEALLVTGGEGEDDVG